MTVKRLDRGFTSTLSIESIYVWTDNPRSEKTLTEHDAINVLFETVGIKKMAALLEDILESGLQINESIVVVEQYPDHYDVWDGNRRISAIKAYLNPSVLDKEEYRKRIAGIASIRPGVKFDSIEVKVTDRDTARSLIFRKHASDDSGIYLERWSSWQRDRALKSTGLDPQYPEAYGVIIDLNMPSFNAFKKTYKIEYTDLQRIFGSSKTKQYLTSLSEPDKRKLAQKKLVEKISVYKSENNVPLSRAFHDSTTVEPFIDSFIDEFEKKSSIDSAFIPSPTSESVDRQIISSNVSGTKTRDNSFQTDYLVAHEYRADLPNSIKIDIDLWSNSVYQEICSIRKGHLKLYPISFSGAIRILIETTVEGYLKKVNIKLPTSLAMQIIEVLETLHNSDFKKLSPEYVKTIKDFIRTELTMLSSDKRIVSGPYLTRLNNAIHSGVEELEYFKDKLNKYVLPFIVAMSNHLHTETTLAI